MTLLRTAQTAVIERYGTQVGTEAASSEPFEVGWASQALWFVRVTVASGGPWRARSQVSPDGAVWVTHGPPVEINSTELAAVPVEAPFGGWLRLHIESDDADARLEYVLYLHAKS